MAEHQLGPRDEGIKGVLPDRGPSFSQVLVVMTLLRLDGFLLLLAGLTLTATLIGFVVSSPVFVIYSPVLLPAVLVIVFVVLGFIASGAFGVTALSSISWMVNYLRRLRFPEQMEHVNRRAQETAGQMGQRTRETGQRVQSKDLKPDRPKKVKPAGFYTERLIDETEPDQ
ncbi:hypothetical protein K2173_027433 [Erythroxylum novogranatense]|uniref:Oleosin n=1 Tax=Erythroxylum novogranatense TaxID=1862640 RepID=A0AAV8TZ20_9ROSI|nr:hypothetical protein K2173_027433 [Erythroxylum novogranatense]